MKALLITILLFFSLFISNISAQDSNPTFLQKFSLEGGGGFHLPFSPSNNISTRDYAGFSNFYMAANLALTDIWGVRLSYANNTFVDKNDNLNKLNLQKLMAEATFKILQSIHSEQSPFEIVAHSGIGLSRGADNRLSDIDKIVNFQIGLMPLYQITKNFSIHLDAIYVFNFIQNQGYNGRYVYDDVRDVTGSYLLLNIGLGVKFAF